jgi:pentose-5-phosphate-3-epimerase
MSLQIVPAILATTKEEYREQVEKINSSGEFEGAMVHIDFADGEYVDNKTIYWDPIEEFPLDLEKEAHLMVKEPLTFISNLTRLGFKRVVFHFGVGQEGRKNNRPTSSAGY